MLRTSWKMQRILVHKPFHCSTKIDSCMRKQILTSIATSIPWPYSWKRVLWAQFLQLANTLQTRRGIYFFWRHSIISVASLFLLRGCCLRGGKLGYHFHRRHRNTQDHLLRQETPSTKVLEIISWLGRNSPLGLPCTTLWQINYMYIMIFVF